MIFITATFLSSSLFAKKMTRKFIPIVMDDIVVMVIPGINDEISIVEGRKLLKKTGQTKSYDENGNEVIDGSLKDDGYYQTGLASSYTRNDSKEIVTDNVTGLEWQDNELLVGYWQDAKNYCTHLSLDGEEWKLPTREELSSLVDYDRFYTAIDPIFENIEWAAHWSLDSYFGSSELAWFVDFRYGVQSAGYYAYNHYVRCVRGDSPMMNSFSRDDSTQIVTDSKTNLQWQDNEDVITVQKSWREAINYCENLTLSGYSDWRLPNHNELYSIVSESNYNPALSSVFQNRRADHYWSSTTVISDTDYAWGINFIYGYDGYYNKSDSYYVRCVRTGQ